MSGDVLSQAEVESLLSAMDGRETDVIADAATSRIRHRDKISPYDFKRPERVGKEQMRALQTMHEGFGRNFGAALSALLRTIVEVKLTSVDQLTYSEFVFSLENPTCFNLLNADAARRAADPRHQPVDPVSDHRPPAGRRQRPGAAGPPAAHRDRAAARVADHRPVSARR